MAGSTKRDAEGEQKPIATNAKKPKKLRVKLGLGSDLLTWLKNLQPGSLEVYVPKEPDR